MEDFTKAGSVSRVCLIIWQDCSSRSVVKVRHFISRDRRRTLFSPRLRTSVAACLLCPGSPVGWRSSPALDRL